MNSKPENKWTNTFDTCKNVIAFLGYHWYFASHPLVRILPI
jgi:hypothetical protein